MVRAAQPKPAFEMDLRPFDTVVVPFPFTDSSTSKRRPALVLSSAAFGQAMRSSVLAMITSAEQSNWLADVPITDLAAAGLPQPCLVRLKLFTLDHRLIVRKVGRLAKSDEAHLREVWAAHLLP